MTMFFWGMLVMYFMGTLLIMDMVESTDEENPNAHVKFALLWPVSAVIAIWLQIRGEDNDDGTSSN